MQKAYKIRIKGIVQGVGFRPFIYKLAKEEKIKGIVLNDTEGVIIYAEPGSKPMDSFIEKIKKEKPPVSIIDSIEISEKNFEGYKTFSIEKSRLTDRRAAFIPPDISMCADCEEEFFSKADFRHHYPFITCINCGPRFSIIKDIPYDRINTAMDAFPMCSRCRTEYEDPENRRFHSQPNACSRCGPQLTLYDSNKNPIIDKDAGRIAEFTFNKLQNGSIVAIKGTGGYLLAVNAEDDDAIKRLRILKGRAFKPFALMCGAIDTIEDFLHVSEKEKELLLSRERPIVLLRIKKKKVSKLVAPGLTYLGVMLPYIPFQHHIFSLEKDMVLIMTSGNISEEPIAYDDEDAFGRLKNIADYFIAYNREITAPTDDSVMFAIGDEAYFIRRSRSFVPVPFKSVTSKKHLIATGGDIKNSFALAKEDIIILSQYLGDLAAPSGYELFDKMFHHFQHLYDFSPEAVIADMHPGYYTTKIADKLEAEGLKRINVQHHHAHIVSVMEEHKLNDEVIGISFDGTGYGTDGTLWGSEFLISTRRDFLRAAHFDCFPLPGGEKAIYDVWKTGISLLQKAFGNDIPLMSKENNKDIILDMIEKNINSPLACSIGRIFDGTAAILGISRSISAEAEAAMLLEEAAIKGCSEKIKKNAFVIPYSDSNTITVSTSALIKYIVETINKGYTIEETAFMFHASIARTTVEIAGILREKYSVNRIALCGGVFQNKLLLSLIRESLTNNKFDVFINNHAPLNDGSIALGQIAIGKSLL